jgi:hypothetical protein
MPDKSFKNDLFISYAHLDNLPMPGSTSKDGWVTKFQDMLVYMLTGRIGREPKIWRDERLVGNQDFEAEILDQLRSAALLISVVSGRYVLSQWCEKEVDNFSKTAQSDPNIANNRTRVLKVIKFPDVDDSKLPQVMQRALGYPFYMQDDQKTERELDPEYGENFKKRWYDQIAKLAVDVAQLIKEMDAAAASSVSSSAPAGASQAAAATGSAVSAKPLVFVAECSKDRRDDRNAIIAELRGSDYTVLPDEELPDDEQGYIGEMDNLLARCKLSIHLVGSGYGVIPDGTSEKSVSVLANERAIERCKTSQMKRIIWLPSGTSATSDKQKLFIKALEEDAEAQYGADLITGTIEDLKRAIHDGLRKIETPEIAASDKGTLFFADCSFDRRDDRDAVIEEMRSAGYRILPEGQLPTEEANFFGALAPVLGQSALSVHIIGSNYGVVPDGPSERSLSVLANELSIEYSKRFGLKRIIWLPSGTKSTSRRQQEFIDSLRNDPEPKFGAQLVTGGLDDLKAAIQAALKKPEATPAVAPAQAPTTARKVIYLICDELDREAAMPLRIFLRKQGFDTRVPAFKGDAATVRQSNHDMLTLCDEAIIFYGAKEDSWKSAIDAEVLKSAAGRASKPPLQPFTYLASPETTEKTEIVALEDRVIDCLTGFKEDALTEFVKIVTGTPQP